ncbi:MAG: chemotaxis protein CheW [Thermodesulfobacteriota bacterium]
MVNNLKGFEGVMQESGAKQLVSFFLNGSEYAFWTKESYEVLKPSRFTRVPFTPEFVRGIFPVRGVLVAAIDLKKRMGLKPSGGSGPGARVLVAGSGRARAGFLVDDMGTVRGCGENDIEPPAVGDAFMMGSLWVKDRVIRVLDMEKILSF